LAGAILKRERLHFDLLALMATVLFSRMLNGQKQRVFLRIKTGPAEFRFDWSTGKQHRLLLA